MAGDGTDVADGCAVPVKKDEKIDEIPVISEDEGLEEVDGRSVPVQYDEKVHGDNMASRTNMGAVSKTFNDMKLNDDVHRVGAKLNAVPTRQPVQSPSPARPPVMERIEDVFQDEIVKAFSKKEFKKFALSRHGLCLKHYDVETIIEDYPGSEEQKFQMLYRWRQRHGKNATPQKIRDAVEAYKNAQLADD